MFVCNNIFNSFSSFINYSTYNNFGAFAVERITFYRADSDKPRIAHANADSTSLQSPSYQHFPVPLTNSQSPLSYPLLTLSYPSLTRPQVTVVEPIIGKTYGFHAVPYQTSQPGYTPLRSVSYAPVQYPAYKHGPVYRPPPGYTREPSHQFPEDGTRYIPRPPRPSEDGAEDSDAGEGSVLGGRYAPWSAHNAQAVFPASVGFPGAPIYAGSYSGQTGYGGQWKAVPEGEAEAEAEAEAETSGAEEPASDDVSASGTVVGDGETSAETSVSDDSATSAVSKRSSSDHIHYVKSYHNGYAVPPHAWWPVSPYPANAYQPSFVDRSDILTPHPAATTSAIHQNPIPAASTTHAIYAAPPADAKSTPGLARRRSITGGPSQHATAVPAAVPAVAAAVPPVEHGLVYAAGSVVPRVVYGDGVGGRHVREGNIPGYYVRCVRHESGPPSVSLVPFAQ